MADSIISSQDVFFKNAPCGFILSTGEGDLLQWNDTLQGWLGYDKKEGDSLKHFYDLLTIGSRIYCETHYFPMLQMEGEVREINLDLLRKDRTKLPVLVNSAMVKTGEGESSIQSIIIDITHRKLYEKELLQSKKQSAEYNEKLQQINEELSNFAHAVAHDLKSPLGNLIGMLDLLQMLNEEKLDKESMECLTMARAQGRDMHSFITDLLDFASAGRENVPQEEVELNKVFKLVGSNIAGLITENEATVAFPSKTICLKGNALEFQRLFQNLIENAIKYRKPTVPPKITVEAVCQEQHLLLKIKDNGIGIPKKFLKTVFGTFARVDDSSKQKGTGIGLATCKKIVEHHHGKIWVESEEGEGSVFHIQFPVS